MDNEGSAPKQQLVTSSGLYGGGGRGAGGKFRKLPPRKVPATPYDRPSNQQRRAASGGGWISKIVHPAYRLISGGANLIIPSFFSSSQKNSPSPPPPLMSDSSDHDTDEEHEDPGVGTRNDNGNYAVNVNLCKGAGDAGPCELEEKSDVSDCVEDGRGRGKLQGVAGASGLSEIEQLIKGKQFCREEIDRIMEILQSRVVDPDQERKAPSMSGTENVDKTPLGRLPAEKKTEYQEKVRWATPTPTPPQQPAIQEDVGASPVDIARAYMGSRTSEVGFRSKSTILNDEKSLSLAEQFASKPLASPTSSKAAICWPGAMLQDQPGYSTPQTQRSKPLRSFPRTPYSRAIYSNSKPKLSLYRGDGEKLSHNPSTPFQSSQTSARELSRTNAMEDGHGSLGPIRRMRRRYGSDALTRESPLLCFSQKGPFQDTDSIDSRSTLRNMNFEHGADSNSKLEPSSVKASSSPEGASNVHPQTSKLARQILEQISRPATPQEKSEEFKLSAVAKKSYSESVKSDEQTSSSHSKRISQGSDGRENSLFKIPSLIGTSELTAGSDVSSSSMTFLRNASTPGNGKTISSANVLNINDRQLKSPFQAADVNQHKQNGQLGSFHSLSRGKDVATSAQMDAGHGKRAVSSGTRPVLPPISIGKSSQKTTFASDNNTGFTFPFNKPSSVFSEPPTPSIMPFSSAEPQAKDSNTSPSLSFADNNSSVATLPVSNASRALPEAPSSSIPNSSSTSPELPTYTFGSKSSNPVVFSSPSMSTFAPNNAQEIQFKFGSGENRVSFSSVGKDAFCC